MALRELGKDEWLEPLQRILDQPTEKEALIEYRERLYYRGTVPTREGQRAISDEVLAQEISRGFKSTGLYRKRLGYFVDGIAVGSESFIREQLSRLQAQGHYRKRKNPVPQLGGIHLSLRAQRSTAVSF